MTSSPRPALRRPVAMTLDHEVCIECGACEELVPGMLQERERIAVTQATLEAMAHCPVGAIRWLEALEGEDPHDEPHGDA